MDKKEGTKEGFYVGKVFRLFFVFLQVFIGWVDVESLKTVQME